MQIRTILLTGDDGYNSIGTRLLIHYLKDHYNLFIAGTKKQQSGVGGYVNVGKDVHWKDIKVDGIKGICVDGTPGDAIEVTHAYLDSTFDLVISGINFGANIGGSFFSSGTIAAYLRSKLLKLTKRGITISHHSPDPKHWFHDHNRSNDISTYLDYPGKSAYQVIQYSINKDLWGAEFINVNLPHKKTSKVKFTKPLNDLTKFYTYPGTIDKTKGIYRYPMKIRELKNDITSDGGVVQKGYISITPCKADLLNEKIYKKIKNKTIQLK